MEGFVRLLYSSDLEIRDDQNEIRQRLTDLRLDINHCDPEGLSMLHWLIRVSPSHWAMVLDYLFQRNIQVEIQNQDGETALIYAAKKRKYFYIPFLIRYGANVNATDPFNDSPLTWCAYLGDIESVEFLIEHGANPEHCYRNNRNAFMWACARGNTVVAKYLLKHVTNINQEDQRGLRIIQMCEKEEIRWLILSWVRKNKVALLQYVLSKFRNHPLMEFELLRCLFTFYFQDARRPDSSQD